MRDGESFLNSRGTVLLVSEDRDDLDYYSLILRAFGYEVRTCASYEKGGGTGAGGQLPPASTLCTERAGVRHCQPKAQYKFERSGLTGMSPQAFKPKRCESGGHGTGGGYLERFGQARTLFTLSVPR